MVDYQSGGESWADWDGAVCVGCDLPLPINDLGLCDDCQAKLERDMIRARDWEYSSLAMGTPVRERESLRLRIVREYGLDYELVTTPATRPPPVGKALSSSQLSDIAPRYRGEYDEQDVVEVLVQILASDPNAGWRELSEVARLLRRYFPDLKPQDFGYKRLRHLVQAHPQRFQTKWDTPKQKRQARLYIRLTHRQTPPSA